MARKLTRNRSLPSIVSTIEGNCSYTRKKKSFEKIKNRRNSVSVTGNEKTLVIQNNFQKINRCYNSSQTDFGWDWVSVFINSFLGIILPTFDIYSDFLFIIGTWLKLYTASDLEVFSSKEEASKSLKFTLDF